MQPDFSPSRPEASPRGNASNPGLLLNRYVVQESLGSGSGGTVNLAWDTRIQRNVAIKRIPLPHDSHQAMAPGLEEARTAAQLHDSRIVNVYDFEIEGDEALLIMEFVDGMSLGALMDRIPRKLNLDEIASVVQNVGKALQHAHQHHVLHLDVKPDNILVDTSGTSKVTDFGIGKLASSRFVPRLAGLGAGADAGNDAPDGDDAPEAPLATHIPGMYGAAVGGTIGYMPPEQIEGLEVTARTDQWAFAVLVYELIVGENPFVAPTFDQSLSELRSARIVIPSATDPSLDPAIDDVLFQAMSLDPGDRFTSVEKFVSALMPFLGDPKTGKSRMGKLVETLQDDVALGSPQERMAALRRKSLGLPDDNAENVPQGADPGSTEELDDGDGATAKTRVRGRSRSRDTAKRARQTQGRAADESYDQRMPAKELPQIRNCISPKAARVVARVASAASCTVVGLLGVNGLASAAMMDQALASTGLALPLITAIVACAVGAVGALWPRVGSAAALALLGAGTIAAGYVANGAIALAISAIWWAFIGRLDGVAATCGLAAPCLGCISMAYMQPLLCGWCLELRDAVLTSVLGAALMITVFPITGASDIFASGLAFASHSTATDLAASNVYAQPWVWIDAAGWVASTVAMRLLAKHGNKALCLAGSAAAMAIIVVSRALGATTGGIAGEAFSPMAVAAMAVPLAAMLLAVWMHDPQGR